ncbi:response regulator transcription factor [Fastidiosibacter lacustris]|uniref:response regulator transcription factor n=1 Tax=Fastidiosibacter lacustris TaxID=2056695 RepID=UPI000E3467FB|nr:response regulator transcription factor [Fastidiosibacter lacustris]
MKEDNVILLVSTNQDDIIALENLLQRYLFQTIACSSGANALEILSTHKNIKLVILDVLLPDMYGIEVCKNIRERNPNMAIIFVSKITDATEVVLCFEAGADDYIETPYNQHILMARIKSKLRDRNTHHTPYAITGSVKIDELNINDYMQIQFGKWAYYPRKSLVTHPDQDEIYLTDKEGALLKLLLSDPSKTFMREEIAKYLNLNIKESMIRDVNIHVHRLRNKLTQGHNSSSPIKAVRSQGYTLDSYLTYIYDGKEVSCL